MTRNVRFNMMLLLDFISVLIKANTCFLKVLMQFYWLKFGTKNWYK